MKILFVFIVLCFVTPSTATAQHDREFPFPQIGQSADSIIPPEWEDSSSFMDDLHTMFMRSKNSKQMDSTLNFVYRAILNDYKDDTDFIRKFKLSEEAWTKYRDAELGAILPFPHDRNLEPLGQWRLHYIDEYNYRDALTKRRIEELMMWYKGIKEGCDNCSFHYVKH